VIRSWLAGRSDDLPGDPLNSVMLTLHHGMVRNKSTTAPPSTEFAENPIFDTD
jgi:hypothetical protein